MTTRWLQRRGVRLEQIRVLLAVSTAVFCVLSLIVYPSLLPPKPVDPIFMSREWQPYSYRCDEVFPSIIRGCTLQLSSVPSQYRIPAGISNVTNYFATPQHVAPYREYLFDYNPSIIQIPKDQIPVETAVYLASFRVSNLNNCFHPGTLLGAAYGCSASNVP